MLSKSALETALGQLFAVIFPPHRSKETQLLRIYRILYILLLLKKHAGHICFSDMSIHLQPFQDFHVLLHLYKEDTVLICEIVKI